MNNKSVSDFVAATMNAVLESDDHKSLFGSTYKTASETLPGGLVKDPCPKCGQQKVAGSCLKCDGAKADDNAAKDMEDESCADDSDDENSADDSDDESDADDSDECSADDEKVSSALDIAIDGLLTASAALDSVGFEKSSTLSLKIASFVVEAKKKEKEKKSKKPNPFAKKKDKSSSKSSGKSSSKGDSNSAKDKKSDKKSGKSSSSSSSSSKKPAKKDDKKSSKK